MGILFAGELGNTVFAFYFQKVVLCVWSCVDGFEETNDAACGVLISAPALYSPSATSA